MVYKVENLVQKFYRFTVLQKISKGIKKTTNISNQPENNVVKNVFLILMKH